MGALKKVYKKIINANGGKTIASKMNNASFRGLGLLVCNTKYATAAKTNENKM
ncbi:hypothetical protein [Colwellia sp. PAMC 21821]|uniref:hypothetical protein n=1 Tax=Colwellia sp. PAMC 21821 TaxID=1816219 RepID=UPI0012DBFCCD|nr:hypothetical protein [Colwellia sp. PAMC 21821]